MCHWGFSPRRDTGLLVHNQDNPKGSLWETIMGVRWSSIFVGILWGHFLQPGLSQLQYLPSKDSGLAVPSKKGDHERQGGQPSTRSKATPLGSSPETLPSPMFLPKKAAGHTEGKTIVLSFFFFFFFYNCYWETLLLSNFPVYFKNCLWRLLNHMRGKKKTFQQQLIARLLP